MGRKTIEQKDTQGKSRKGRKKDFFLRPKIKREKRTLTETEEGRQTVGMKKQLRKKESKITAGAKNSYIRPACHLSR